MSNQRTQFEAARAMRSSIIALMLSLLMAMTPALQTASADDAADLFLVEGYPARLAQATRTSTPVDEATIADAPMAHMVAGVLGTIAGGKLRTLVRAVELRDESEQRQSQMDDGVEPFYLHLSNARGQRTLMLRQVDAQSIAVIDPAQPEAAVGFLSVAVINDALDRGPTYRGGFDVWTTGALAAAGETDLPRPYESAPIVFDRRMIMQRMYRGMRVISPGADRDLDQASIGVRVPSNYDPKRPTGLLVWVSPTPDGRIPRVVAEGAEKLGIVCVGVDNAGNKVPTPSRCQLVCDAMFNAMRRYHIDPARVYITGMSGGGRISSMLGLCFPEHFSGSIPIVGMATYHALKLSDGRSIQAFCARPSGTVLRQARTRPVVAITGDRDFNHLETMERVRLLREAGFALADVVEVPGLAHQMPDAASFLIALRQVDAPARTKSDSDSSDAQNALDRYAKDHADRSPRTASERAALLAIVRRYPWTAAAWQALELLDAARAARLGEDRR